MDKIKKISDAIRLGATFRPQCRERYYEYDDASMEFSSCAIGAAKEATGIKNDIRMFQKFKIQDKYLDHPAMAGSQRVAAIIVSLNDDFCWTREAIADWLAANGL